jgi:hypothetical protein
VSLSNSTIAFLAEPFFGGNGPSHASGYIVPEAEANKRDRVLYGLRWLRDGRPMDDPLVPDLAPDDGRLRTVAAELIVKLLEGEFVAEQRVSEALARDGLELDGDHLVDARPVDDPADQIAEEVARLFGERLELAVARNHYEQAERAFDHGDWEAANAQFRSAFEATYDALAAAMGCPPNRTGGAARMWLQNNGHIDEDEADLMRTFATFAGRAGSHAGLSDATDSQLRRHFATALIAFGVAKLG